MSEGRESVPYKALDEVVDGLADYLVRHPVDLDEQAAALQRLFPVLGRASCVRDASQRGTIPLDPVELRQRAFEALFALLSAIASERVLVIAIDDLHWGDADSAAFLCRLISGPRRPNLLLEVWHWPRPFCRRSA